jgi:hypothetical protein
MRTPMCTLSNARAMGSSRVHLLLRRVDRLQHQTVETERILLLCGHLTRQKNSTPPPDSFAAFVFVCTAHASYATLVTSIQHDERCKEEQVQYSQRVVELRESILQRTVLIDNVNDLNNAKYLKKLANHLQPAFDQHRGWVFGNPDGEPFANTIQRGGTASRMKAQCWNRWAVTLTQQQPPPRKPQPHHHHHQLASVGPSTALQVQVVGRLAARRRSRILMKRSQQIRTGGACSMGGSAYRGGVTTTTTSRGSLRQRILTVGCDPRDRFERQSLLLLRRLLDSYSRRTMMMMIQRRRCVVVK